jgi:hypothetical protein
LWTFKFIDVKVEFAEEGIFFTNRFSSLKTFVNKKVGILTKPTKYTTFKTDIIKVVLVFSISNFFINKNSQGRKSVCEIQL